MTTAVLVMAYGTPAGRDEVARFYTDVRRGRPPTPEQLADLERRYDAIGGVSPLNDRTAAQVRGLQRELDTIAPGEYVTFYGAKHSAPKIEDAVREIGRAGIASLIGLVLAPHYSVASVGEYVARARDAAAAAAISSDFVERWGDDETLVELLAARVTDAVNELGVPVDEVEVVVTAHSLPERTLASGDAYTTEVATTASLVARRAGLTRFRTAWQSAGRTPEPWLGPDILVTLEQIAREGASAVVVCPAGFTSDHLEVLYDVDIEARQLATRLGLRFARTRSLNDDPALSRLLARRVVEHAIGRADGRR